MTITIMEYAGLSRDNSAPLEPATIVTRAKAFGLPAHPVSAQTRIVRVLASANARVLVSTNSSATAAATDRYIAANGEWVFEVRRGTPVYIVAVAG